MEDTVGIRKVCEQDTEPGVDFDHEGAAMYLRTSPRHVRKLQQDGRLAFYRIGKLIRFRKGDLDQYLQAARVESKEVRP
ncbi:MAG: excisionase family DNA-binding protein [Actinomycetota bacterium]